MKTIYSKVLIIGSLMAIGAGPAMAEGDVQTQIDAIKGALPKFAIPMREVGDRFQNTYFAAKGGNWALAAYMSKYMNGAMNPAKVTKPDEYKSWNKFYTEGFDAVNKAIQAKDMKAFEAAYKSTITKCNSCHEKMDYGFIQIVKLDKPADMGLNYTMSSEPGAVPK
jgi:cytochrome c553